MDESGKGQTLINSIIGEGTYFRGSINLKGLLRIDGDFEGDIKTDGRILVGKGGRAKCRIEADTIVVGGMVKGSLRAHSKVVLLSTCLVIGNIQSPRIIIEEGVLFHGRCTVSEDENVLALAPAEDDKLFSVDWGNRPSHAPAGT